jgi:hypothetical protein
MATPVASPHATPGILFSGSPVASPMATPMASPVVHVTTVEDADGFFAYATRTTGEDVERYLWGDDAEEIAGVGLTPVSLTVGTTYDGVFSPSVWLFAEFRNTSPHGIVAPHLVFEAKYDGRGFGAEYAHPYPYLIAPGEHVFYVGIGLYSGAVLFSDWTDFTVTFDNRWTVGDEYAPLNLRLDVASGRIYNDGSTDMDDIYLQGVARDATGVFSGMCRTEYIRATIPAGLFVRLPKSIPSSPPGSLCSHSVGEEFASRLGTGPQVLDFWLIDFLRP